MIELFPSQTTHSNLRKIEREWLRQLKANPHNPSIGSALIRAYWRNFLCISIIGFISESLMGVGFYATSLLIDALV